MAVPARRTAAGLAAPGWGEYRRQMMAMAQLCTAAVTAWLAAGGDESSPPAVAAGLLLGILRDQGAAARHVDVGEAVIEESIARAVAEDRAARPRGGHLRALP